MKKNIIYCYKKHLFINYIFVTILFATSTLPNISDFHEIFGVYMKYLLLENLTDLGHVGGDDDLRRFDPHDGVVFREYGCDVKKWLGFKIERTSPRKTCDFLKGDEDISRSPSPFSKSHAWQTWVARLAQFHIIEIQ